MSELRGSSRDPRARRAARSLKESDAALGVEIDALDVRIVLLENAVTTPTTGSVPDAVPRWVKWTVPYTLFADPGAAIDLVLDSLPAQAQWTHIWIKPITPYAGAGPITTADVNVPTPTNGYNWGSGAKTVDVLTPGALATQGEEQFVTSDPAAVQNLIVHLDLVGGVGNDLTAGVFELYLLMSIPGGTGKELVGLGD